MADEPKVAATEDDPKGASAEHDPKGDDAAHADDPGIEAEEERQRQEQEAAAEAERQRIKQLEDENRRLKAEQERRRQPPAGDDANGKREKPWKEGVQEYARRDDPVAQAIMDITGEMDERDERLVKAWSDARFIDQLPADERSDVYQHYMANRHRLGDPAAARAELRAARLEKAEEENQKLREQLGKFSKAPNPNVARTDSREVPASEHKMTRAEWKAEQEELQRRENEGDLAAGKERRRKQLELSRNPDGYFKRQ